MNTPCPRARLPPAESEKPAAGQPVVSTEHWSHIMSNVTALKPAAPVSADWAAIAAATKRAYLALAGLHLVVDLDDEADRVCFTSAGILTLSTWADRAGVYGEVRVAGEVFPLRVDPRAWDASDVWDDAAAELARYGVRVISSGDGSDLSLDADNSAVCHFRPVIALAA